MVPDPTAVAPPSKVLVVDDNESNRVLAQETLEDEGHQVILAANGQEALAAFGRDLPDCVLLDVRMPDLDGFAVCERLRAMPGGAEVPVVFLTALREVDTFDHALRSGGDDFLTKPIRPGELLARVHAALQLRHMRSTLRTCYDLFKEQRDGLVRLQLEKERVIAFLVHDLKTPLSSVVLNAQVLLANKTLPSDVHEVAHEILSSSWQLNRMILNVLDLAKADQGQLAPVRKPVVVEEVAQAVLDELRLIAAGRAVELRKRLDAPRMIADEELLKRVLANLVENAIRHSPMQGAIEIATVSVRGGVELRVTDAGSGVSPELREKIFEAFSQGGEAQTSTDNRGLGLSFCKRAVEAHGGRIHVEDAMPGAAFCAFFPDYDA